MSPPKNANDNIGNGSIIHAGEVQKMSAGKGIFHSEYNPSSTQPVHFLQIWIMPNQLGIEPSYEQRMWTEIEKKGKFKLIGSPDGKDDSITIHQDIYLYITALDKEQEVSYKIAPQRRIWLQIVKGAIKLHDYSLVAGDGAAITLVDSITLKATDDQSEILLFDMN
ncbi:MAG: pirin family protein [Cyanobacteria bacterium J083]|nr:MAG: pirin family protein [Cyanobacteria bacterium J083]